MSLIPAWLFYASPLTMMGAFISEVLLMQFAIAFGFSTVFRAMNAVRHRISRPAEA